MSRHILITGMGRSGTTFLMCILTELGFDTGYTPDQVQSYIDKNSNAGLECDVTVPDRPYVLKSTWMAAGLNVLLERFNIELDYLVVPVRSMHAVADSRLEVYKKAGNDPYAPGGLFMTENPNDQLRVLQERFCEFVAEAAEQNCPVIYISYCRMMRDVLYLYQQLSPLLGVDGMEQYHEFFSAYNKYLDPGKIRRRANER